MEFIAEAVERADIKEKIKMEKDDFCKKALAQKSKKERIAKRGEGEGRGVAEGVGGVVLGTVYPNLYPTIRNSLVIMKSINN